MTTKREYRDRYYLVMGLIIGASMSFLGSLTAGSYFTFFPEPDLFIFTITFSGFIAIFIVGYAVLFHLEKKIRK